MKMTKNRIFKFKNGTQKLKGLIFDDEYDDTKNTALAHAELLYHGLTPEEFIAEQRRFFEKF